MLISLQKGTPKSEEEWVGRVKGIVKAHLKLRDMSYADLADALRGIGVEETEANLRNKISRGRFTAVFMLQCMRAMEVDRLMLIPTPGARSLSEW